MPFLRLHVNEYKRDTEKNLTQEIVIDGERTMTKDTFSVSTTKKKLQAKIVNTIFFTRNKLSMVIFNLPIFPFLVADMP